MKRLNSGFTLAEVLITLAIIGVVAAIVLPSVMSNYQYKSVGVKLAKFISTLEGSTRPFVVNNDNFTVTDSEEDELDDDGKKTGQKVKVSNVTDFVNESFIFKTFDPETSDGEGKVKILRYPEITKAALSSKDTYTPQAGTTKAPIAILKDGTAIQVYLDDTSYGTEHIKLVPVEKFGAPVFRINFDPKVQGLPKSAQKNFNFAVTELGYVFPAENDGCTWQLYNEGFTTTSKSFADGKACHVK